MAKPVMLVGSIAIIMLLLSHAGLEVMLASAWSGRPQKGGKPMAPRTWIPNYPVPVPVPGPELPSVYSFFCHAHCGHLAEIRREEERS